MIFEKRFFGVAACAVTLLGLATTASANITGTGCLVQGSAAQSGPTTVSQFTTACTTAGTGNLGIYTYSLNTSGTTASVNLNIPPGTTGASFVTNGSPNTGGSILTDSAATGLALAQGPGTTASTVAMSGGPGNTFGGCGTNNCYSTWWDISFTLTGNVASTPVTVTHDDGVVVIVNGVAELTANGPTSAENSMFNFSGSAGQTVNILYDECCGAPAQLTFALPLGTAPSVPEPGSIVLFGTAVLGVVFQVRKRRNLA